MNLSRLAVATALVAAAGCSTASPRADEPSIEFPSAAAASPKQERYGPGEGESLVTAAGQISNTDIGGDSTRTFLALVGGGYFLTPEHEVGGQISFATSDPENGSSVTAVFVAPYYNYNWRQSSRTWYYAGPHAGFAKVESGSFDDSSFALGVHAGLRHWLSPTTSVFVEPRYTWYEIDSETVNDLTALFGISVTL